MATGSDNFNAANTADIDGRTMSVGGKTWVQINYRSAGNVIGIVSNEAGGADGLSLYYPSGDTAVGDVRLGAVWQADRMNLGARITPAPTNNGYEVRLYDGSAVLLIKVTSGSESVLATHSGNPSAGVLYELECIGTAIKVYEGGSEILSVTDSSYSSGYYGMVGIRANGRLDDFQYDNDPAGGAQALVTGSALEYAYSILGALLTASRALTTASPLEYLFQILGANITASRSLTTSSALEYLFQLPGANLSAVSSLTAGTLEYTFEIPGAVLTPGLRSLVTDAALEYAFQLPGATISLEEVDHYRIILRVRDGNPTLEVADMLAVLRAADRNPVLRVRRK